MPIRKRALNILLRYQLQKNTIFRTTNICQFIRELKLIMGNGLCGRQNRHV